MHIFKAITAKVILSYLLMLGTPIYYNASMASEVTQITSDIVQTSPLCSVPREIVHYIASFLPGRKNVATLAGTCRFLHETATVPNKKIVINYDQRMLSNWAKPEERNHVPEEPKKLLPGIAACIKAIIARQGKNPIAIWLGENKLGSDMESLRQFLCDCSTPEIAPYIQELYLNNNGLTYVPEEIAGLTGLRNLNLSSNVLKKTVDIQALSHLPNLVSLDLGYNKLEELDPDFTKFKALECLDVSYNNLQSKDIPIITQIKALQKLDLSHNKIPVDDLAIMAQLPALKSLTMYRDDVPPLDLIYLDLYIMVAQNIVVPAEAWTDLNVYAEFVTKNPPKLEFIF